MILGLIIFRLGRPSMGNHGDVPLHPRGKSTGLLSGRTLCYAGSLACVPLVVQLFHYYEVMNSLMLGLSALALAYVLYEAFRLPLALRNKLLAAMLMIISSVFFWAFYSQNSGSLNLFAMRNVDMHLFGIALAPLSVNNFLPPFWVISLSPVFAWLWLFLAKRKREPSTPVKFALAFLFLALSFSLLGLSSRWSSGGLVSIWSLTGSYFLLICGELCLSPIGLSMVTSLSPARMVGVMMGIWFLATSLGEFLASKIGALMSIPEGLKTAADTLPYYEHILLRIAEGSAIAGLIFLALVPVMKKWMGRE